MVNGTWLSSTAALGIWSAAVTASPSFEVLSYYTIYPCIARHAMVLDAFMTTVHQDCDACVLLHLSSTLRECGTKIALTPFRLQLVKEYFFFFSEGLTTSKSRDVASLLITKFSDAVELVSPDIENGKISAAITIVLSQLHHFDHEWVAATEAQNKIRTHLHKLLLGIGKELKSKPIELNEELARNTNAARDYIRTVNRLNDDAVGTFLTGLVGGFPS